MNTIPGNITPPQKGAHIRKEIPMNTLNTKNRRTLKIAQYCLFTVLILALNINVYSVARTASVSGPWSSTTTWGGSAVPTSADAVTINSGIVVDVDIAANCASITYQVAAAVSTINIIGSNSLTVVGTLTIPRPSNPGTFTVNVGAGTLTAAIIAFGGTTGAVRTSVVTVSTGIINVTGNITSNGVASILIFTDAGTLNAGAFFMSGTKGTFTASTGTVNFNGAGAQSISPFTYTFNNVTLSGGGAKTLTNATINGVLSIESNTTTAGTIPTYGPNATLQYKGTVAQTTGIEFPSPAAFGGSGGVIINNSLGVKIATAKVITNGLSLLSGTLDLNSFALTTGNISGSSNISSSVAGAVLVTIGSDNTSTSYLGSIQNGSGIVSVTKNGSGTLTISGTNTYTGITSINAGILSVSSINNGGVAGNLGQATNAAANLVLGGGTLQYTGATTSTDRAFTLTAATTSTIEITDVACNLTISGASAVTSGGITKTGVGILTFSGANTYTGATTINAGILSVGTILAGGTASNIGQAPLAAANIVLGGGTLQYTGGTFSTDRGFTLTNATTSAIEITTLASTLTFGGSFTSTTGSLTKSGTGSLSLGTGAISLTDLAISAGTLVATSNTINIAGNFTNSGMFTHNSGTVNFNGVGAQNIAGVAFHHLSIGTGAGSGTKTLLGSASLDASGVLSIPSGILEIGNYDFVINNSAAGAVTGVGGAQTYNATHMISTGGTGYVYKNFVSVLQPIFPIGSNGYYSPFILSSITTAGTSIGVRTVPTAAAPGYVNKYWDVVHAGVVTSATATFTYDPVEITNATPNTSAFSPSPAGITWQTPSSSGTSTYPANSLTITGTSAIAGYWTMKKPSTFYSYQTGSWNTFSTWTSDPSGTLQIGSTIPSDYDIVIILTGRTVSLPADISSTNLDVTIDAGGFLDLTTFRFTNTLLALRGFGTLRLASVNFPSATTNTFVNAGNGTTEYNNTADFTLPAAQATYNNLTINASGFVATQLSNLTLNGNLYVKRGTFQINDAAATAALTLTINGNVTIDLGASILVGKVAVSTQITDPTLVTVGGAAPFLNYYTQFHTVIVKGDFTNNGTVKFTNIAYPDFGTLPPIGTTKSGAASVYFQGLTDNTLTCNGTTNFYNLILDKGTDQTYVLTIYSSAYTNFRLFGANNATTEVVPATANPNIRKALWIRNGTLKLTGISAIPSLSEGTIAGSEYYIPTNGALLLDGSEVVALATADAYEEITASYSVGSATGLAFGVTQNALNAIKLYGKLQINDGYFSTRESGGIMTDATASGQFIMNGGIVDSKQFLGKLGSASFSQSGGTFVLRGRFQRSLAPCVTIDDVTDILAARINNVRTTICDGTVGSFCLNNANNVFTMSGGTMRIYDVCGTGVGAANQHAVDIISSTANINVTGGTLELVSVTGSVPANDSPLLLTSNASFGNVLVNSTSTTPSAILNTYPLTVLSNLTITAGTITSSALDVTIGGDFAIASGATYTPSTNTTTFNGTGAQSFANSGTITTALNNFTINKSSGTLTLGGSATTYTVNGTFTLQAGTLADGGKTVDTKGNLVNSGTHTGSGKISLSGTATQTIGGSGSGVFCNLELNNTNAAAAPVSLTAATTVSGNLNLVSSKVFNIGTYNLIIGATASITATAFSNACYIHTSGQSGDGGVTKDFASNGTFTFTVGCFSTNRASTYAYTPATIGLNVTSTVPVTVIPVGYEHPSTTVNGQSLTFFWRVKSTNQAGIVAGSMSHTFVYNQTDVVGTEASYIPTLYNRTAFTWNNGTAANPPINTGTNTIIDWTTTAVSANFLDADYTAGLLTSFGTPTKFYSRATGVNWNANGTWSYSSGGASTPNGAGAGVTFPGANDIAIIEGNRTINLSAAASCASLQIAAGSVLDVITWTGSTFSMVVNTVGGNGKIRVTAIAPNIAPIIDGNLRLFSFPVGDFTDFNINGGTTEFYSTTNNANYVYILPASVNQYGNLILSPNGMDNLSLPNVSTTIYGDLTCNSTSVNSWIGMSWDTRNWGSPATYTTIEKTVHVLGGLYVNGGTFEFMDDYFPQHLVVDGDVVVANSANAKIDVIASGWCGGGVQANTMEIGGSLINNRTVRLNNTKYCDVTFTGNTNASITGATATQTVFRNLTVNKGTSQTTTLTCDIASLTTPTDNWLTLTNGTLIYNRTGNFTINTTTNFTIPATAGLTLNTASNVLISNTATSGKTLFLNGNLTLLAGNVYVGPNGNITNNADIEYSGSGSSALDIQGGNLFVTGQIRRNTAVTSGVLNYSQSAGAVTIYGNNATAANAKLEVLNTGSSFNMSGGTLTIVRGGGTTYGDLYLRPESSTVTGGTIVFTPVATTVVDVAQTYNLDANIPLFNVTVTGKTAATARIATLNLLVNSLVIGGDLTLSNTTYSVFNSNNLNVTINGNMINNGTYNYGTNTTTFSGGTQTITGTTVTNFNNLTVSPVTSLTPSANFTVNGNLTIGSGSLILGAGPGNVKLSLLGSLTNNGTYSDNNTTGGISLAGTSVQQIYGTGSYGRLELNNASGARFNNDVMLQNNLALTQGILNINQYLLTLTQNSIIEGAPFGLTKMIQSDGVVNNLGVSKFFSVIPPGPVSFTFPVGVSGKYTPAIYTITASGTVGYINVNPVNSAHPTVLLPTSVLQYYWSIESSGISAFDGSVQLQYLASDVSGTESTYIAAKLLLPAGDNWSKASPGAGTDNVDETNHKITFNSVGSNNLNGDYTAGLDAAIPNQVPTYQSNQDGNWNVETNWDPVGTSPACPVGGPNGFKVIVNHIITIPAIVNQCYAYNTTINGTLKVIAPSYGHNLGEVDGTGILYLESGNLPAGNFTTFFDCSGSAGLEYGGSGTYDIIATQYSSIPKLYFSGTGTRTLPSRDLTICQRLLIGSTVTLDNSVNNKKLTILGTMELVSGGAFSSGTGTEPLSTVTFAGTSLQTLGGTTLGDFTGSNGFNNLEVNNSSGLTIGPSGNIEVKNNLLLTSGLINTTSTNKLTLVNTASTAVIPAGGSSTSFINGPLVKQIPNGNHFLFPIGKGTTKGHDFTLTATQSGSTYWTTEFFTPNATYASLGATLLATNTLEYWSVSAPVSKTATIKIAWNSQSDLTAAMTVNGLPDMRLAEYSGGLWNAVGTAGTLITSGTTTNGDVTSSTNVTIPASPSTLNYTIGSITNTTPKASFSPAAATCGAAGIPVTFTSFVALTLPYTLNYTLGGVAQTPVVVNALPYTLPTPSTGAYKLTGFLYNNSAVAGVVDPTIVTDYANPLTSTAGADQSLCDLSGTTLVGNNPAPYTGLWTIISGSGGTLVGPTAFGSVFTGVLGRTYSLKWTNNNNGCTTEDLVIISFPISAAQPGAFTAAPTPVCQSSTGNIYTVPNVAATTYAWSYSGTGAVIAGTTNSVSIAYDATATSGTLSVTANNACGIVSTARTKAIVVNTLAVATFSYAASPYCSDAANPSPTFSGGGVAGTFSSTAGLVFVSTATGQINLATSTPGTYTVTNTIAAAGVCGAVSATSSITITTAVSATISYAGSPFCSDAGVQSVSLTGTSGGTYSSTVGLTIDGTTGAITPGLSAAGTYTVTYTIAAAGGCGGVTATTSITITTLPVVTSISYPASPWCINTAPVQNVSLTGDGGGAYSAPVGLSIDAVNGDITPATSIHGTYIVTYTIAAAGGCPAASANTSISAFGPGSWWGATDIDWFNSVNWVCNIVPDNTISVVIPIGAPLNPIVGSINAQCKDVVINSGTSLTLTGSFNLDVHGNWTNDGAFNCNTGSISFKGDPTVTGTSTTTFYDVSIANTKTMTAPAAMNILHDFTNNGNFTHNNGTVNFNGTSAQLIGGSATTTFSNFKLNNTSATGLTLNAPVNIDGTLYLDDGYLFSSSTNTLKFNSGAIARTTANTDAGSASSFVTGPVNKEGLDIFTFPIGFVSPAIDTLKWASIGIDNSGGVITDVFSAEYKYHSAQTDLGLQLWGGVMGAGLNFTSSKEFWDLTRVNGGSSPSVTLHWNDATESGILCDVPGSCTDYDASALTDLTLVHWNTATGLWEDMGGTATGTWPAGQITSTNLFPSYSPITFGSKTGKNPLPVNLLFLSAKYLKNRNVSVDWSTSSEVNCRQFIVERSADAKNFNEISTVSGAGNSNKLNSYNVIDNDPLSNTSFYRLKQVDFDGKFEYSKIVSVSVLPNESIEKVELYPNPTANSRSILLSISGFEAMKEIGLSIVSILGNEISKFKTQTNEDGAAFEDVTDYVRLPKGVYFVLVNGSNGVVKKKLIVN